MPVFYSILCVPTLHINHDRNGDVLLNSLISDFITLCVKNHMRRKALETQDFYEFSLCSNTTLSIWSSLSKLKSISCSMIGSRNLMDLSHWPLG